MRVFDDNTVVWNSNGEELKNGDVLRVDRDGKYVHWGIYCEEPEASYVIHYSAPEGSGDFKGVVMKTPLKNFIYGAKNFEVMTEKLTADYHRVYSGEETAERAKSQIGRGCYDALLNNCEHFAVWCKTGKHESSQTKLLRPIEMLSKNIAEMIMKI